MLSHDDARARVRKMATRAAAGRKPRAVQKRRPLAPTTWYVPPPLTFTVPGRPQPKERARRASNGHFYTPPDTVRFESAVGLAGLIAVRSTSAARADLPWPMRAFYRVTIAVVLETGQRADLDNIGKAVLDGLNSVLWDDDSQVQDVRVTAAKLFKGARRPGVTVVVEVLPSGETPPGAA